MLELEKLREELETLRGNLVIISNKLSELQNEQEKKEDLSKLCTIDEKIILKNLWSNDENEEDIDWWIGRTFIAGNLEIHDEKPNYSTITGRNTNACDDNDFSLFSHLFKFIEKGQSYRVADLIQDTEEIEL